MEYIDYGSSTEEDDTPPILLTPVIIPVTTAAIVHATPRADYNLKGNWQSLISISVPGLHTHISLSKTLLLKIFQLDPLLSALSFLTKLPKFRICLSGLVLLENDSKSHAFLGLQTFSAELADIVLGIDGVLTEFGFDAYYQPPVFHASLEMDPSASVINALFHRDSRKPFDNSTTSEADLEKIQYYKHLGKKQTTVKVDGIDFKVGKRVYTFDLV